MIHNKKGLSAVTQPLVINTNTCLIQKHQTCMLKYRVRPNSTNTATIVRISRIWLQMAAYHGIIVSCSSGGHNATYDRGQNVKHRRSWEAARFVCGFCSEETQSGNIAGLQPGWDLESQAVRTGQVAGGEAKPATQQKVKKSGSPEPTKLSFSVAHCETVKIGSLDRIAAKLRYLHAYYIPLLAIGQGCSRLWVAGRCSK